MSDSYSISDSPSGMSSLTLKGDVSSKDRESLRGMQFEFLFIRYGDHSRLDYLDSSFETIRILDVGSEQFDWASILRMPSLERLSIGAYWAIPWQSFGNEKLESLSVTWNKSYAVPDLSFPSLKHLKVVGWSDEGLDALAPLKGLTYLDLVDSRSLQSLTSLKSLLFLSTLRLRGAPKLTSLEGVQTLEQLVALHLDGLKKIRSYNVLSSLNPLRGLVIQGSAPIDSLARLSILPKLELLMLGETKVEDGDLAVLKCFPALKNVMFKNKRGYNWTSNEATSYFRQPSSEGPAYTDELEDALKMKL